MTAYREADVAAKIDSIDSKIDQILSAVSAPPESATTVVSRNERTKAVASVVVIGLGLIFLLAALTSVLRHDDQVEQRHRADCISLCGSMGLNGGTLMRWTDEWTSPPTAGDGPHRHYQTGLSCVCGDGHGSAVRVDPDGVQTSPHVPANWTP